MNKKVKLYLIFMTIIAFAIGVLGTSMFFLFITPIKGLFLATAGFLVSWIINEEVMKYETFEEDYEY